MRKTVIKDRYLILPEYRGKDVYTQPPPYEREGGAKFTLDENLSDRDLAFLFEVVGHEGIIKE